MGRRNIRLRNVRATSQSKKHSSRVRSKNRNKGVSQSRRADRLSPSQQEQKVRCLAAVNRVRRGQSPSLSSAARAEGTTLRAIRKEIPDALIQDRPGGRIRVKKSDRYSAQVQVLTKEGALSVMASGSRQRELVGQHRATFMRVLRGAEPKSALDRYRGKKVGGHELVSDYAQLVSLAKAGIVGNLDTLYVSPDVAA